VASNRAVNVSCVSFLSHTPRLAGRRRRLSISGSLGVRFVAQKCATMLKLSTRALISESTDDLMRETRGSSNQGTFQIINTGHDKNRRTAFYIPS
jgi:hypothetical protein